MPFWGSRFSAVSSSTGTTCAAWRP
jgi:hypothetical protein